MTNSINTKSREFYPYLIGRCILPALSKMTDIRIWSELGTMMSMEKRGLDELKYVQFSKLRSIIKHAHEKVPFYRDRFKEIGITPDDIHDDGKPLPIPATTKEDIMTNFPERITAQGMDRTRWKYVASSGTTRQIMGIHDFRKANINWAAGLRAHKLAGNHDVGKKWMEIPPHMCTNICGINDQAKGEGLLSSNLWSLLLKGDIRGLNRHIYQYFFSRRHEIYRRITLPSFGSEGTNIPEPDVLEYIRSIKKYQPYLLEGLPLYLYTLAKYLIRKNLSPPRVGVIKPFGGSVTQVMKETIQKAFNCGVYDTYGCSEMGFMACDCDQHDGLHLFMDLYYVEICRNGKLAAPGELGKLYITDLENQAMPWIRYDIGDVGRYLVEDHGCGRRSVRLKIEGRVEDTLCNSHGELFTSDQVFDFFHGIQEIDNFQLIEKTKGIFDLLCVPNNGVSINKDRIVQNFKEFFDPDVVVKAYNVKTIKAEDGGKFRFIKSKSFMEM